MPTADISAMSIVRLLRSTATRCLILAALSCRQNLTSAGELTGLSVEKEAPVGSAIRPSVLFADAGDWTSEIITVSTTAEPEPARAEPSPAQIEYPIVPNMPAQHWRPPSSGDATSRFSGDSDSQTSTLPPITRFRRSAFQGIQAATGVVGGGTGDAYLNINHLIATAGFAVPLGSPDDILLVSPGFRMDFLQKDAATDLPAALYEPSVRFFHQRPIDDRLGALLILTPSIRSDFTTTQDAFRVFGVAMLTWQAIPGELAVSAGVIYLDRADVPAIPGAGLTWTPSLRWKVDLQFPQPRISYRLNRDGNISESWVYLGGGFGGNSWAVTRTNGEQDVLTINDLRMLVGYEKVVCDNRGWFVEAGWAFNRSMEYEKNPLVQDFSDGLLARAGISF